MKGNLVAFFNQHLVPCSRVRFKPNKHRPFWVHGAPKEKSLMRIALGPFSDVEGVWGCWFQRCFVFCLGGFFCGLVRPLFLGGGTLGGLVDQP